MVETAPTGTEMPSRKRNLNFMSVHFKQREISFPWSVLSILLVWLVQSMEQLINLVSVCDGAVCSLVSSLLLAQRKVEQTLRTVSFQGHCLPYLFFTVLKEHCWVPFNWPIPKSLCQHSQTATHHLYPKSQGWKSIFFSLQRTPWAAAFTKSSHHAEFPWCAPRRTKDHVFLLTVKKNI